MGNSPIQTSHLLIFIGLPDLYHRLQTRTLAPHTLQRSKLSGTSIRALYG